MTTRLMRALAAALLLVVAACGEPDEPTREDGLPATLRVGVLLMLVVDAASRLLRRRLGAAS